MRGALTVLLLLGCTGGAEDAAGEGTTAGSGPPEPGLRTLEPVERDEPLPLVAVGDDGDASLPWLTVGDPDPDGLPVLVHTDGPAWVGVSAGRQPGEATWTAGPARTTPEAHHGVQLRLTGLPPGETIHLQAWVAPDGPEAPAAPPADGPTAQARVRLAPQAEVSATLDLVVGGDLGGQGRCRALEGGYAILDGLARLDPDVFVANGDLVYVDNACPELSPEGQPQRPGTAPSILEVDWTDEAALHAAFAGHWRYNLADPALRRLYARTAVVAQWDDHEVVNDFGAAWSRWLTGDPERPGYPQLVDQGRRAFRAFSPVPVHPDEPERIHRSLRWGKHAELFVLDARSHRSPNELPDSEEVGKRLLGDDQRHWLREGLEASDATWKLVSLDVPLSTPTGSQAWRRGRDGVASGTGDPSTPAGETDRSAETGFERIVHGLLFQLDRANVDNVVFLTTDVHHSRSIRYAPDLDGDGDELVFYELISGPLSAWMGQPGELDPTFSPQSLFALGGQPTASWIRVEPEGEAAVLKAALVGADGAVLAGSELVLPPLESGPPSPLPPGTLAPH